VGELLKRGSTGVRVDVALLQQGTVCERMLKTAEYLERDPSWVRDRVRPSWGRPVLSETHLNANRSPCPDGEQDHEPVELFDAFGALDPLLLRSEVRSRGDGVQPKKRLPSFSRVLENWLCSLQEGA
jgi:hypothetical protein